jgi:hypothetical protein
MVKSNGFVPASSTLRGMSAKTAELARSGVSTMQENVQALLEPRQRRKALKRLRKTLDEMRGNMRAGSSQAERRLRERMEEARKAWRSGGRQTERSLRQVRRRGERLTGTVAERLSVVLGSAAAGLGLLQVALERNMRSARQRLDTARNNLEEARQSWREERERRARRRRRARFIFRVGLVTGVVLALCFAPRPGAETRRRLGGYLRNVVAFFQSRPVAREERYTAEHVPLQPR